MDSKMDLFKKKATKFDVERDKKDPQDFNR